MKKTAVEWLAQQLPAIDFEDPYYEKTLHKAKEMEKQQLKEMYLKGIANYNEPYGIETPNKDNQEI